MKKGDVVLIQFPFTDLKGNKNRPAIVLLETETDVTVVFITTKLKWQREFDILILPSIENGLKENSLIRINKISTLDKDLVIGRLGELTPLEIVKINKSIIKQFSLDDNIVS